MYFSKKIMTFLALGALVAMPSEARGGRGGGGGFRGGGDRDGGHLAELWGGGVCS